MSASNPGIMKLAKETSILQVSDPRAVSIYAKRMGIELAVVGPEAPLVNGVVDALTELGVRCVGPIRKLALLEGDKGFCRDLLSKHHIRGNPFYRLLGLRVRRVLPKDLGPRRD